jgi:pimeloyl-ACP methyl ester carboxylesterase
MVLFPHTILPAAIAPRFEEAVHLMALSQGRAVRARLLPGRGPVAAEGPLPLVALHGIARDARAMWQAFCPPAAAAGRSLIVPHFSERAWPRFQQIGRARPDLALIDLMQQAGLSGRRVDLFGFSGGAQLAHRFAMLYPHRVATLHLAAPGWYTLPDPAVAWPLGLGGACPAGPRGFDPATLSRLHLRQYLSLRVRLWVGALDVDRDPSLRMSPELDALQGPNRLERARRYAAQFEAAARAMGIRPDIALTVLPGCRHDVTDCARAGGLADRVVQGAA